MFSVYIFCCSFTVLCFIKKNIAQEVSDKKVSIINTNSFRSVDYYLDVETSSLYNIKYYIFKFKI